MTTELAIETWTDALEEASDCVPDEIREQVLKALLEKELLKSSSPPEPRLVGIDFANWDEVLLKDNRAKKEAVSLMIQVLVRTITRDHSKENAAKVLFREHRQGTGGCWLPEYLEHLPGIKIDKKKCIAIANSVGPSLLDEIYETMENDHD